MIEPSHGGLSRFRSVRKENRGKARAAVQEHGKRKHMENEDLENDELEDIEETDPDETDADEDDIDETDAGDGDSDDDDPDGDDDEDGDDEEGKGKTRSEKRIKKLLGRAKDAEKRVKELEGELEEAKKSGGDDAETYVAAAKAAGLLPGMLSKDLAGAIKRRSENDMLIARYEDWLDDEDNEELQIGDETWSRKKVRARLRELREENASLERRHGGEEEKLRRQVKELFELGKAALKAGWKPGKKDQKPAGKAKKATKDRPDGEKEKPKAKSRANWGDATGESSLAALIERDMKRKKGD